MNKVKIPKQLLHKLGPEMKMDVHWIDIKLKNNSKHYGMVVRGGKYITGSKNNTNGEGSIPFKAEQILNIRREKLFYWLPFW